MIQEAPILDADTARTILDTLDELGVGLSARQIRMKQAAKAALAYWAAQQTLTLSNPVTGSVQIPVGVGA